MYSQKSPEVENRVGHNCAQQDKSVEIATKRFIRLPQVMEITGYSRPSIYRLQKLGFFPPSYRIGGHANACAVAWLLSDVLAFIDARVAAGPASLVSDAPMCDQPSASPAPRRRRSSSAAYVSTDVESTLQQNAVA
jgi:prophage regulatory protein